MNADWNARMNDVTRNLDDESKKQYVFKKLNTKLNNHEIECGTVRYYGILTTTPTDCIRQGILCILLELVERWLIDKRHFG